MIDLWARRAPIRFLSQRTIMTTLKSRLQLSLLNRKKGRNLLEKGFTLVELMIVIVIVGVLSGVALPNFLGTRNKAEAQAEIGAMAGFAKLCSANMVNGDPTEIDVTDTDVTVTGTCDGNADVTMALPAFERPADIGGIRCGAAQADGVNEATCTLTVDAATGTVTGAWA